MASYYWHSKNINKCEYKMKFIITGGAGFIGSAVIRHIINNTNDSVVNIDKLTYAGNLESLASISDNSRYHFIQADICDATTIATIFKPILSAPIPY